MGGKLTVNKVCDPDDDGGKFNLLIDNGENSEGEEDPKKKKTDSDCGESLGPVVVTAGDHTVSETAGTGTDLDDYITVIGEDCAADGSVSVAVGEEKTCTITNTRKPTLTVEKVCDPVNDDGRFNLLIDGSGSLNTACGGSHTQTVTVGSHTVSETAGMGTNLDDYDTVFGGDCDENGDVSLAAGQNKTCTVTNIRKPTLTVEKACDPVNDDGKFNLLINGSGTTDSACGDSLGPVKLPIGQHQVSETAGTGTDLDDYVTTFSVACPGGVVNLKAGENKTCIITNTRIKQSLTIQKICKPEDDDGLFNLLIDGSGSSNTPCGGTYGPIEVEDDDYMVSETAGTGTDLDDYEMEFGGACDKEGNVTVGKDENKICTITNTRKPTLTVEKECDPEDDPGLFNLLINGSGTTDSACGDSLGPVKLPVGQHQVSETAGTGTDLDDYVTTFSVACPGGVVNLKAGENKTCIITNTKPENPTLKVRKECNPDNDEGLFNLWIDLEQVTEDTACGGSSEAVEVAVGVHKVDETAGTGTDLDGYTKSFGGDCDIEGNVSVKAGEHKTCIITNTRPDIPTLTVRKECNLTNDKGLFNLWIGLEQVTEDTACGGSSAAEEVAVGVVHKVGETAGTDTDLDDYEKSFGGDCDTEGNVSLKAGEHKICTIINRRGVPPAQLMVSKDLVDTCVVEGNETEYIITIENVGNKDAQNVVLRDRANQYMKDLSLPTILAEDGVEPEFPKSLDCEPMGNFGRKFRCTLGGLPAGESIRLSTTAVAKAQPLEGEGEKGQDKVFACNRAMVPGPSLSESERKNRRDKACRIPVEELRLEPGGGQLPPGKVGSEYPTWTISVLGGKKPVFRKPLGVPPGMSARFVHDEDESVIEIKGTPKCSGEFKIELSLDDNRCDSLSSKEGYDILIEETVCKLGEVSESRPRLKNVVRPSSDLQGGPDESLQKVAVDKKGNRYLAGFVYGEYKGGSSDRYNMRIMKIPAEVDPPLVKDEPWDIVPDSLNHDFAYAIAYASLDPDAENGGGVLFVGGASLVEEPGKAWHEAVLLEIDATSGDIIGEHRETCGAGTTSVFYDIATRMTETGDLEVFAVGERQVDPTRPDQSVEAGALISRFGTAGPVISDEQNDPSCHGSEFESYSTVGLKQHWREVRTGQFPTRAYSVQVPSPDCDECLAFVGGIAGDLGWIDTLEAGGLPELGAFKDGMSLGVQDMALPQAASGIAGFEKLYVAGSERGLMTVIELDVDGFPTTLFPTDETNKDVPTNDGLLRGIATDEEGSVYATGIMSGSDRTGVLIKFRVGSSIVDFRPYSLTDSETALHDVVTTEIGAGVVAGEVILNDNDHRWLQAEFECEGGTPDCEEE